jgi:hypothetical protein
MYDSNMQTTMGRMRNAKLRIKKMMTSTTTFIGNNYSIEAQSNGDFLLVHPVSENETFGSFEELVEAHPVCEESREFFFRSDADMIDGGE